MSPNGVISIDHAAPHRWFGVHSFSAPVYFSSEQAFAVSCLVAADSRAGAVVVRSPKGFEALSPTGRDKVLYFDGTEARWGKLGLSTHVVGILPASNGGTGQLEYRRGDILFAVAESELTRLRAGLPGQFLVVGDDGLPAWSRGGNVRGEMSTGRVPYCGSSLALSDSPISVEDGGVVVGVVSRTFSLRGRSTDLVWTIDRAGASARFGQAELLMNEAGVSLAGVCFSDGSLVSGKVPASAFVGVLPQECGGTGLAVVQPGDMLFVDRSGRIARLPAPAEEGMSIVSGPGGMPQWGSASGKSPRQGVQLETDGKSVYFVAGDRRRRLSLDEDRAPGGIQSTADGGTGSSLGFVGRGALLVGKSDQAFTTLEPGLAGHLLASGGPGEVPRWLPPPVTYGGEAGVKRSASAYTLDTAFSPDWQATHRFSAGVFVSQSASVTFAGGERSAPPLVLVPCALPANPPLGSVWSDGDDVFIVTRRGTRSMLSPVAQQSRVLAVPLCSGVALTREALSAIAAGLPNSPASPASGCRWKVVRLEVTFTSSAPPPQGFALHLDGPAGPMLETPLSVPAKGSGHTGSSGFLSPHLFSGDVVSLRPQVDWPGGHASAYLVVEVSG